MTSDSPVPAICERHPERNGARYASGRCKACQNEAGHRWATANPQKVSTARSRLRKAHPERGRAERTRWRKKNPERNKAAKAASYAKHAEHVKAGVVAWRAKNKDRVLAICAQRRARRTASAVALTDGDKQAIRALYARARELTQRTGEKHHVDHIKPLAKGGLHHPANLQVLRAVENLRKGAAWPAP